MAETPIGYLPDRFVQWTPRLEHQHHNDTGVAANGRRQAQAHYPTNGLRRFTAVGDPADRMSRRFVSDFLNARRGNVDAFYAFNPLPSYKNDLACGSITAQSWAILPLTISNPRAVVVGSLDEVRVAGVSQSFTRRSLVPRPGAFATLRLRSALSQYIDCGSDASLRPTGAMTISAWVYLCSAATHIVVSNETTNASGTSLAILSGGAIRYRTNQAGASTTVTSSATVPTGAWTHVAVIRNGSNVTFYINGANVGTSSGISNPVAATVSFRIGGDVNAGGTYLDGMIADVHLYSVALSDPQIATLASTSTASPNYVFSPSLKGWWWITEGTGSAITDYSGAATNAGTATNAPVWAAGEEEVTFTGNQTGAVTAWGNVRERLLCTFGTDTITQDFLARASDLRSNFAISLNEVF
jgi:hypothetical protein